MLQQARTTRKSYSSVSNVSARSPYCAVNDCLHTVSHHTASCFHRRREVSAHIVTDTVSVAGSRTPFLARGETSAELPDTLLFHGLGGSARHWLDVLERLPDDRRWIAVDL